MIISRRYRTLVIETQDGRILRGTYPALCAMARREKAIEFGAVQAFLVDPTPEDIRLTKDA